MLLSRAVFPDDSVNLLAQKSRFGDLFVVVFVERCNTFVNFVFFFTAQVSPYGAAALMCTVEVIEEMFAESVQSSVDIGGLYKSVDIGGLYKFACDNKIVDVDCNMDHK